MPDALWLHDAVDYWTRVQPAAEFVSFRGESISYSAAAEAIDRIAGALARSLPVGARVAILSRNSVEMLLLYYAASKAGVVPVPLNYRLTANELAYILDDAGATVVIAQLEYLTTIDEIRGDCPRVTTAVAIDGSPGGKWVPFDAWLADPIDTSEVVARRHDDAIQIYTSGTTGRPKGAVLTQVGLCNLLHQWRFCFPFAQGERLFVVAPLYHVGGTFHSFHAIGHGGSVFLQAEFNAAEAVRVLDEERVSLAFLVPSMIQSCLDVPGVAERRFEHFRVLSYGASPINELTLRRALDTFGCDFVQSFGMTECPCITYLTPEDHRRALAGSPQLLESTGRVGPGSSMRVVDEDGADRAAGDIGEILGRGPQLMRGYWNLPDETAHALAGGWMHTGDAGLIDADGYLYVRDRIKDMIVSGAENVYPREIEAVLLTHSAVADVAVIGVPSDRWGEIPHAIVVRRTDVEVQADELVEYCRPLLAGFKRPRSITFVDELPRNPSGKVLKRVLREPYWSGRERRVS